jgi:hypothetical protein
MNPSGKVVSSEAISTQNPHWSVARFPSQHSRERFLDYVRLWNRAESLPRIEMEILPDGICLRYRSTDACWKNVWRLIDSFGGWVPLAERV